MPRDLNIAVIGAGTFGRNHLRVYRRLRERGAALALSAVVEPEQDCASGLKEEWGVPVFLSVEDCLKARSDGRVAIDAASVTAPTAVHHRVAARCLEAGIDLLVEKPVAKTLGEADDLAGMAEKTGRIVQVGHVERFNPGVAAARRLVTTPMFFEAHRLSVFTPRSLDVDVVLDLMIHDLDIVLDFARSPVAAVHAVGLPVLSQKVDIANVRVEFESGAVANFTASRVSTEKVRKLRFFQPGQYVSIDYARRDLLVVSVGKDGGQAAGAAVSLPPGSPSLKFLNPAVEPGEPLEMEIAAFLDSVRTRKPPLVTARQGREALSLALRINEEMAAHARRAGLSGLQAHQ